MVSDSELMRQFLNGDDTAFTAIVERYERLLLACARRFFRDHDRAQDICQLVWIQLFLSKPFAPGASLKPWLVTVLNRKCIDAVRSEKPVVHFSRLDQEDIAFVASLKDEDTLPDEAFESVEECQRLAWAIDQLPLKERVVLWLHVYQDLSHAEIARRLSCPPDRVKTRIYRARLRVHQIIIQRENSI